MFIISGVATDNRAVSSYSYPNHWFKIQVIESNSRVIKKIKLSNQAAEPLAFYYMINEAALCVSRHLN